MLALLRTPRWQGFTAVVILAIVAFGLLSRWQWDRAEVKQAEQRAQALAERDPITPSIGDDVAEFTPVAISGTFDDATRRFVRQRPLEGRNGFWVMEQLSTPQGSVWVLRGWTPSEGLRAADNPDFVDINSGPVTVTGVVRPLPEGEKLPEDRGGLPPEQVTELARLQLPEADSSDWYVQQIPTEQGSALVAVPLPEVDDLQNISYAIQWLLFAAVAIGGWFFFLRREARESSE